MNSPVRRESYSRDDCLTDHCFQRGFEWKAQKLWVHSECKRALGCSAIPSNYLFSPLQGLNASRILAFAFDPVRLYRGYALTDEGDLLAVVVPHENRGTICKASALYK